MSWERVSNMVKLTENREDLTYIISGIVGESTATEFFYVMEEVSELPPIEDLLKAEGKKLKNMLPTKVTSMYGLTYSLQSFCTTHEHFIGAFKVLQALTQIEDEKPREEIQTLGMELLLNKIYNLEDEKLIFQLAASPEYREYRKKVGILYSDM